MELLKKRLLETAHDELLKTIKEIVNKAIVLEDLAKSLSSVTDGETQKQFKGMAIGLRLAAQMLQKDLDGMRCNLGINPM